MDWLNLHASELDSPEYVGSDTCERGTWLSLLRYCVGQENGGRIQNCDTWKDRQWQQLARVTLREVTSSCRLFTWDGVDLVVWGYPAEKENEVKSKRELAKLNGRKGGRPKSETNVGTQKKPTLVISPKAEGEGEGEGEGNKTPIAPVAGGGSLREKIKSPPPPPTPATKPATQLRVEALMRRRPATPLGPVEEKSYRRALPAIEATTPEDWAALEAFYAAPQSETFTRKDLLALLNNWNGEIDRARGWLSTAKKTGHRPNWAAPGEDVI